MNPMIPQLHRAIKRIWINSMGWDTGDSGMRVDMLEEGVNLS